MRNDSNGNRAGSSGGQRLAFTNPPRTANPVAQSIARVAASRLMASRKFNITYPIGDWVFGTLHRGPERDATPKVPNQH